MSNTVESLKMKGEILYSNNPFVNKTDNGVEQVKLRVGFSHKKPEQVESLTQLATALLEGVQSFDSTLSKEQAKAKLNKTLKLSDSHGIESLKDYSYFNVTAKRAPNGDWPCRFLVRKEGKLVPYDPNVKKEKSFFSGNTVEILYTPNVYKAKIQNQDVIIAQVTPYAILSLDDSKFEARSPETQTLSTEEICSQYDNMEMDSDSSTGSHSEAFKF